MMKHVGLVVWFFIGILVINFGFVMLYDNVWIPSTLERSTLDTTIYFLIVANIIFVDAIRRMAKRDKISLNIMAIVGIIPTLIIFSYIFRYLYLLLRF